MKQSREEQDKERKAGGKKGEGQLYCLYLSKWEVVRDVNGLNSRLPCEGGGPELLSLFWWNSDSSRLNSPGGHGGIKERKPHF